MDIRHGKYDIIGEEVQDYNFNVDNEFMFSDLEDEIRVVNEDDLLS